MRRQSLVFFGNECLSSSRSYNDSPILSKLVESGWEIEALVIKSKTNRSRRNKDYKVVNIANQNQIPVKIVRSKSELEQIEFQSKLAVLASFGLIIPESVLDRFPNSIVNIHPSLLPSGRGPTPIESAILTGKTRTGVSLMRLTGELDSGPIYCQSSVGLSLNASKLELTNKLANLGADLLINNLDKIASKELLPTPQDHSQANYTSRLTKSMAEIDWFQSAESIDRKIRAHIDWPSSQALIKDQKVIIWKSKVVKSQDRKPIGECWFDKKEKLLVVQSGSNQIGISEIQVLNRKIITALDFYNSYF